MKNFEYNANKQANEANRNVREAAVLEILRVAELMTRIGNAKVFGKKLTQAQFNVLMVLKRHNKVAMSQKEILTNLISTKGNLSVHISNLTKMGLVRNQVSPCDSRMHEITLTEAGHEILNELEPLYMQYLNEITRGFLRDEAEKLLQVLGCIEEKCREVLARE
ncbi:MAG: MarR family transcriptional regulator [Lentisphaeria bacterium]